MVDMATIARGAKIELARRHFYDYCRLKLPNFYKPERTFLKELADGLENFVLNSDKHILLIEAPPRHGKSLTGQGFTEWLFGKFGHDMSIMTGSYNETLSTIFARGVRNTIQTIKADSNVTVYSDIFPNTKVKYGEASQSMWSLDGSKVVNYLATSPGGTATGIGAKIVIIDDVIKNAEEAYNERILDGHWEWFNNTVMQRLEGENYKIIVIMTRWAERDLAGRLRESRPDDLEILTFTAVQDNCSMLCSEILSRAGYEAKTRDMNPDIVEANYNQKPIDVKGRLYQGFKEWERLPADGRVLNFTDTADTGSDFLCSINGVEFDKEFYITDLVFTDEAMEITEPAVAHLLFSGNVNVAKIESNNGGRGFARNVERIIKEKFGSNKTIIESIPQTKNKESRILASSAWVQNHVYMPPGWKTRFPEFYKQVMNYQKKGKNAHDDAPDVLASIYENIDNDRRPTWFSDDSTSRQDRAISF